MKSLVAAGYGAALLLHETSAPQSDPHITIRPLKPVLSRPLGIARRIQLENDATEMTIHTVLDMATD